MCGWTGLLEKQSVCVSVCRGVYVCVRHGGVVYVCVCRGVYVCVCVCWPWCVCVFVMVVRVYRKSLKSLLMDPS